MKKKIKKVALMLAYFLVSIYSLNNIGKGYFGIGADIVLVVISIAGLIIIGYTCGYNWDDE